MEAPDRGAARRHEGAGPTSGPSAATRRPVHGHVGGAGRRGAAGCPAVGLESPRVGRSKHLRAHSVDWRALFDETRIRWGARRWPGTPPGRRRASGGAHKIGHYAVVRASCSNIFSKRPLDAMPRRGPTVVSGAPHVLVVVWTHTAQRAPRGAGGGTPGGPRSGQAPGGHAGTFWVLQPIFVRRKCGFKVAFPSQVSVGRRCATAWAKAPRNGR